MEHIKLFEAFVNESKMDSITDPILREISDKVRDGKPGRKLFMFSKGGAIWTKGDGRKFRDPNHIKIWKYWFNKDAEERAKINPKIKTEYDLIEFAFNEIGKLPGAKKIQLSNEFEGDTFRDAYVVKDYIYTLAGGFEGWKIDIQTKGILRNKDIWRTK